MTTLYGSFTRIDLADGVIVAMADSTTVRVSPSPAPDAERLTRAVDRAAAFRRLAALALRGAAAAQRRAGAAR